MKDLHIAACGLLLTLFLTVTALGQHLHAHGIPHTPTGYPVVTAATSGSWDDGATWVGGAPPGPNSVVIIPEEVIVTVDHVEANPANSMKWVRVDGVLAMSIAVDTRIYAETIYIAPTGVFAIGSPLISLPSNLTAEVVFTSPGTDFDRVWDEEQVSRGLIAEGKVKVYGAPKTHATVVANNVLKDTRSMTLATVPWNWEVGDEIVLAGTYFRRFQPFQDELRTIGGLTRTGTLTITATEPAFQYDHLQVSSAGGTPLKFHVANLTRNVIFRSQTTTHTYDRGHIMLTNADSQVEWAALIDLGRTDKSIPLDDFVVSETGMVKTAPANLHNRRGRYSLHVHKAGATAPWTTAPTKVTGCVAKNTPGWAFANHGSHVDFWQNVAYDFTGAGFVTEDGDELGSFIDNIAIRGKGDGIFDGRKARINFDNEQRPQPLGDFAFMGDGFWFSGPAVRVNGAVANSLNGNGMIWHTTGAVDPATVTATYPFGSYVGFPMDRIAPVYGVSTLVPRTWVTTPTKAIIADLPILECANVQSYANFIGFRLRFNNHDSNAWYGEDPFRFDLQIVPAAGQTNNASVPTRLTESISNLELWNNEAAYLLRYAGDTNWSNVAAINRLDYDDFIPANNPSRAPIFAAESFFQIKNMNFAGLLIDGWDIANWLDNATTPPPYQNINVIAPTYRNYALTNVWHRTGGVTCTTPTLGATSSTATHTTLSWSGGAGRYLLRYRIANAQQWNYKVVEGLDAIVPTLAGQNYVWQVIRGCTSTNTPSYYTPQGSFTTP